VLIARIEAPRRGQVDAGGCEMYAPGTVGRVIVILRYVFNLAIKWGVTARTNPASGIPVPPDVQRSRYLSKEEASRLLASMRADENQIAAKAIMLLFLTGARRNEVTQAKWSFIDWRQCTLFVPNSKNGQPRFVQLNSSAIVEVGSQNRWQSLHLPRADDWQTNAAPVLSLGPD
jgi:integrase